MTRRVVYGVGLWVTFATTIITLISIVKPLWITHEVTTSSGHKETYQYGLHKLCDTYSDSCRSFPESSDCRGENGERRFCSMWRSVAFMMNFSVVLQLALLVAFGVTIFGGKQKRDKGWKIITGILGVVFAVQCASMAIVAFLYDHDERFILDWSLDTSWILCTVSWVSLFLLGSGLLACVALLPEEGGYELIPPP
jgi:hypothetical protein